jgi:hypothetical protein
MLNRYAHLTDDDAERAALKAGGFPVPERVDIGSLEFPDEQLRPVVPVPSLPGATQPSVTPAELAAFLQDPNAARVLRWLLLQAAESHPPGTRPLG